MRSRGPEEQESNKSHHWTEIVLNCSVQRLKSHQRNLISGESSSCPQISCQIGTELFNSAHICSSIVKCIPIMIANVKEMCRQVVECNSIVPVIHQGRQLAIQYKKGRVCITTQHMQSVHYSSQRIDLFNYNCFYIYNFSNKLRFSALIRLYIIVPACVIFAHSTAGRWYGADDFAIRSHKILKRRM